MFGQRLKVVLVLSALLITHAILLSFSIPKNYVVLDEVGHVPAGVSHWQTGNFVLYRVNPPLGRMLATIPVLFAKPNVDYSHLDPTPGFRADWSVGRDFAEINQKNYFELVCLARWAGVVWSLIGIILVFVWSRSLYGEMAGCFAAALWCFDPTINAFAQVVTPDVPASVSGLGASYMYWLSLRKASGFSSFFVGILLGIAQLTKFTMLLLYFLWPLIWFLSKYFDNGGDSIRKSWRKSFWRGVAIGFTSVFVINLGYAFDRSFRPLKDFSFASRILRGAETSNMSGTLGNRFRDSWAGTIPIPLPAEYIQGLDAQQSDFESNYPSYLNGVWRNRGWWYYYLNALLVKEPVGFLILFVWVFVETIFRLVARRDQFNHFVPWISSFVFLAAVSSQTGFNHHMRYILPAFPYAIIATSRLACLVQSSRLAVKIAFLSCLVWAVVSVLAVYPHSMSYFNEAVGGSEQGGRYLLDSNVDWGQDLLSLRQWIKDHPEAKPLRLAFFHFLDPRSKGVQFRLPPPAFAKNSQKVEIEQCDSFGPLPGYYAMSVNYINGIMFMAPDGEGGWQSIDRHDYFSYIKRFKPVGRAGYSIFIYHITRDQANADRVRMGLPLLSSSYRE